jgi:hypothetical protein
MTARHDIVGTENRKGRGLRGFARSGQLAITALETVVSSMGLDIFGRTMLYSVAAIPSAVMRTDAGTH